MVSGKDIERAKAGDLRQKMMGDYRAGEAAAAAIADQPDEVIRRETAMRNALTAMATYGKVNEGSLGFFIQLDSEGYAGLSAEMQGALVTASNLMDKERPQRRSTFAIRKNRQSELGGFIAGASCRADELVALCDQYQVPVGAELRDAAVKQLARSSRGTAR